jgi:hypothetical protein
MYIWRQYIQSLCSARFHLHHHNGQNNRQMKVVEPSGNNALHGTAQQQNASVRENGMAAHHHTEYQIMNSSQHQWRKYHTRILNTNTVGHFHEYHQIQTGESQIIISLYCISECICYVQQQQAIDTIDATLHAITDWLIGWAIYAIVTAVFCRCFSGFHWCQ